MDDFSSLVIDINADDLTRHKMSACIYCGNTTGMTRDHVVSVSWSGFKRSYKPGDVVKCCRECNIALSNTPLFSISKKADFLANHYTKKFKKIINHPEWTDREIQEMSREFKTTLIARNNIKSFCMARITHCILVSFEDSSLNKVKQQTPDNALHYRILCDLYHGYSYEHVAKTHNLEVRYLKKIFRTEKLSKLVIAFKYEMGIPFDYPIYRVFKAIRDGIKK